MSLDPQIIVAIILPADCDNLKFLGGVALFYATAWILGLTQTHGDGLKFRFPGESTSYPFSLQKLLFLKRFKNFR